MAKKSIGKVIGNVNGKVDAGEVTGYVTEASTESSADQSDMLGKSTDSSLKTGANSGEARDSSSKLAALNRPSWPDSLEKFVIRSMLQASNDPEKETLLGQQLPRLLQLAIDSGCVHTNDWDNQKIPALHDVPNIALKGNLPSSRFLKAYIAHETSPHIVNHPWIDSKHNLSPVPKSSGYTPVPKSLGLSPITFGKKPPPMLGTASKKQAVPAHSSSVARDFDLSQVASSSLSLLTKSSWSESNDYVIDVTPSEAKSVALLAKRDADFELSERKRKRAQRFEASSSPPLIVDTNTSGELRPVIGTCQTLEKSYLRLTSEPDPSRVRPEPVLKNALTHVSRVYERDQNYRYALDQFKSIRQDLTVQNIRNSFSIFVYETNARVLLVNNDLGEFNQCQSQLQELYSAVPEPTFKAMMAQAEFFAYRIIYMILTRNDADLVKCRAQFFSDPTRNTDPDPKRPWFAFTRALFSVHIMDRLGDYSALFSLIDPFRAFLLLTLALRLLESHVLYKVRARALLTMSRAYRKLPMSMLQSLLRLADENAVMALFASLKILYTINESREWDCAAARPLLVQLTSSPEFNKVDLKGQV